MVEIEVKIKVDDVTPFHSRLGKIGAVCIKPRQYEENILYDFEKNQLYQKHQALRLRQVGKKSFLTFKGTPKKSRQFKIRNEFETEVKNKKEIKRILKSLELKPVFEYQKYRTVFKKKRVKICLDEIRSGHFIELEGPQSDIVRLACSLGFSRKNFIKEDYISLLSRGKD